jgi:hypothetical protein
MRLRRQNDDDLDEDDDNYVEDATRRLWAANLIPPVRGLHLIECVEVSTTSEVTPDLTELIARALGDIPHIIKQVSPDHGVMYRPPS